MYSIHKSLSLSISLSIYLSIYLSLSIYIYMHIYIYIYTKYQIVCFLIISQKIDLAIIMTISQNSKYTILSRIITALSKNIY